MQEDDDSTATQLHSMLTDNSGGLRTGTPISEHDFSYNFSHHISRTLHVVNKEVAL